MRALHEGQWREVSRIYVGQNGSLREASVLGDEQLVAVPSVTLTVAAGTNFSPWVELTYPNGADGADIYWYVDGETSPSATGQKPTLGSSTAMRSIEFRAVAADGSSAMDRVVTINCGFNMYEDSGRYNLGAAYNWDPQPLINIVDLQNVPNLIRFCAAHAAFVAGSVLDFTGLSKLEYIECYIADVRNVILTGCTSLIRLCLEQTMISELDLNPVRHSLRDLRSAAQRVASLTFTALEGPMEALYHYCIRDQVAINIYSFANLPVIEEFWAWNTHQSVAIDQPISPVARSFPLNGNTYDQASVDNILLGLATNSSAGSYSTVELSGSAAPSSAGLAAARTLVARGWTVTVTGGIPEEALPEPIAEYGFSEGSGAVAADSSGNANDGTVNGWSTGYHDYAAVGDDGSEAFNADVSISTTTYTVMAWVYPLKNGHIAVGVRDDIAGGTDAWGFGLESNGLGAWVRTEIDAYNAFAPTLPTNTWAHIALTVGTGTMRLYVNGVQAGTGTYSGTPNTTGSPGMAWGGYERWGSYGIARVDEIRVFDTALTAEQITTYMNTPVVSAALVGEWLLNEGTGTTAADSSGHNATATIAAWVDGRSGMGATNTTDVYSIPFSANNVLTLDSPLAVTLMFWYYPIAIDNFAIMSDDNVILGFGWSDSTHIKCWSTGNTAEPASSVATPLNNWVHVAATVSSSFVHLYINGALVGSSPRTGPVSVGNITELEVGNIRAWEGQAQSIVDNIRLFDGELDASSIATWMNTPVDSGSESTDPNRFFFDDFSRSDRALDGDNGWVEWGSWTPMLNAIVSGRVEQTGYNPTARHQHGSRTEVALEATIDRTGSAFETNLVLKSNSGTSDVGDAWMGYISDWEVKICNGWTVINGSEVEDTHTPGDRYRFGLTELNGSTTLYLWKNGVLLTTVTTNVVKTGTWGGVHAGSQGVTTHHFDDFAFYAVATPPAPLPGTVLARWPLHNSLEDTSGNGRDGTAELADTGVSWTPVYTDGPVAGTRALYFANGNGDANINWGRTGLEPTTLGFTWMAWFKGSYLNNSGGSAIFAKTRAAGSTRSGATIEGNGSNAVFTVLRWRDDLWYSDLNWDISDWHHICVVDTDTERSVYLDGVAVLSEARTVDTSQPFTWEDYPWRTGWNATLAAAGRDMCVSNLRMFHGGLTQAEIQQAMNIHD